MQVKSFQVGIIGANCHVVSEGNYAILIDLGGDYSTIKRYLTSQNLKPLAVLLTHGHYDHIAGANDAQNDMPIYIYKSEEHFLNDPNYNLAKDLGANFSEHFFNIKTFDEGMLKIGNFEIKVIHTPGHTSGSCCFVIKNYCFSGDTIFQNGFGRYDLKTGSFDDLKQSIYALLDSLSDDTLIFCGHGANTTVKEEKIFNPFYNYVKNKI